VAGKLERWRVGELKSSWEEFRCLLDVATGRDPCAERAENHPQMSGDEEKLETAA
jgi:hypothetical protein